MAARFEKTAEGPFGTVDGFDPKTVYQMVPFPGNRVGLNAITEDEQVELTFETSGIARFGSKRFDPPSPLPLSDTSVALPPRTRFNFELVSMKPGNTSVVMRNRAGKDVASLLISVKKLESRSYSLCRLSDMRRTSPWPVGDIRPMMQKVEKTFFQQANIRLFEKGNQIFDVNINDRDLLDPLVPVRIVQPENKTLNSIIVSRSPLAALAADFTVFFTWDLQALKKDIVGSNFGQICYVEFNSTSPLENALTTAHELGHGLGLGHSGANTLMAGDGISRSSILAQFEIDTINQSDLSP